MTKNKKNTKKLEAESKKGSASNTVGSHTKKAIAQKNKAAQKNKESALKKQNDSSKNKAVLVAGSSSLTNGNSAFDNVAPVSIESQDDKSKTQKIDKIPVNSAAVTAPQDPVKKAENKEKTQQLEKIKESQQKREDEKKIKAKKKKRNKKIAISICCVVAFYFLGVLVFSFLTYPRTYVADADLSLKTKVGLKDELNKHSSEYTLNVEGNDYKLNIAGKDIDYQFDANTIVDKIDKLQISFAWPVEIFKIHDFRDDALVNFDKNKAESIIVPSIENHNVNGTPAKDAGFNYDATTQTVSIKPEVIGNSINTLQANQDILSAIGAAKSKYVLEKQDYILPSILSTDPRIDNALNQANKAIKSNFPVLLSSSTIAKIDPLQVSKWLVITPNYTADLDMDAVNQWADSLAASYNTIGSTRTYTTPYGKAVSVTGGSAGWEIDTGALAQTTRDNVMTGFVGQLPCPCSSSLDAYNGPGQRDWGPRYIDVDLSTQTAYMYDSAGSLVWQTEIVSGKPDGNHDTPTGVYTINNKESPSVLKGLANASTGDSAYETKVQYWMAFVGNGVGFHDATWQSGFGGDRYKTSAGSHGCVNISMSAAQSLYSICNVGDVVVVHG